MKNSNVKENIYISLVVIVLVACLAGASLLAFGFGLNSNSKVASAYDSGDNVLEPLNVAEINLPETNDYTYAVTTRYVDNADAMAHAYIYPFSWFKERYPAIPNNAVIAYYAYSFAESSKGYFDMVNDVAGTVRGYSYTTSTSTSFNRFNIASRSPGDDNYWFSSYDFRFCYSSQLSFSIDKSAEGMPSGYVRLAKVRVYYSLDNSAYDNGYNVGYGEGYKQGAIDVLQETPIATFNTLNISPYSNESLKMGTYRVNGVADGSAYFGAHVPAIVAQRTGDPYKPAMRLSPGIILKANQEYVLRFDNAGPLGDFSSGNYFILGGLTSSNEYTYIDGMSTDSNYLSISFVPSVDLSALVLSYNVSKGEFAVANPRLFVMDATIQDIIDSAYESGHSAGYDDGLKVGKNEGFNKGYRRGVDDAGEYTFMGLIGAVVDAPVSAFRQMFNFEVLGVNLSSFFMAMLTACLIIVIIRIVLGGK